MIDEHPVSYVQWVPIDMVQANDYNPNSVAPSEMRLLYLSIKADGYTQPIVTVWDDEAGEGDGRYIIVDGFHRYFIAKAYPDIALSTGGLVPIVVLDKEPAERMAATVRHNRARGRHSVAGMSNLVLRMLQEGRKDQDICTDLGLEAEELLRLKHITGFSALMKNATYGSAWETERQVGAKRDWIREHPEDAHQDLV